jgi:hypothetical protein
MVVAGPLAADEHAHDGVVAEEWGFAAWHADLSVAVLHVQRVHPLTRNGWYWAALHRAGTSLLHVAEWDVTLRSDAFLVKGPSLWAELECVEPFRQWTFGNETYAVALDDPEEGFGRAYGNASPIAWDIEWYAVDDPSWADVGPGSTGYLQSGVAHGDIELPGGSVTLDEVPAVRWHLWGERLGVPPLPTVRAHLGIPGSGGRACFSPPSTEPIDLVLTPAGWALRAATTEGGDRATP